MPQVVPKLSKQIWTLIIAAFTISLGYGLIAPIIPLFANEFNVNATTTSIIISSFAAMRVIFAPLSGQGIHKFGEKKIYLTGITIVTISTGACALSNSYWHLLILRSLGGIGSTMFTVSAMGLLIHLTPQKNRGKTMSFYAASFLLGSIFGPTIGSLLSPWGFRLPFIIYAFMLTIAGTLVAILLKHPHIISGEEDNQRSTLSLKETLKIPAYKAILGTNFINGWVSVGVRLAIIPLFVGSYLDYGARGVGIVMTSYAIGNALLIFPSGNWSDKYGRKKLIITGCFVSGFASIALGVKTDLWWHALLSGIAGAGSGLITPSLQAKLADIIGSRARGGQVLSSFQMASDIGTICSPLIVGIIADFFSYRIAFIFSGSLLVSVGILWVFSKKLNDVMIVRANL